MFEQMNEQIKTALKPMTDLATLNMNTMQSLAEKQTALYSTLLSDGMAYVEKAAQQKDVTALTETNKAYLASLQETLTEASKGTYSLVTEAQQKATDMLKGLAEEMTASFAAVKS